MHNLSTVMRFEIVRALKKKSFWIMALGFPLIIAGVITIVVLSNKSTDEASKQLQNEQFSLEITDTSGLISPQLIDSVKAHVISDKQTGINDVKSGRTDGYIYYPSDPSSQPIEVYGQDVGIFKNGRYDGVADYLLSTSVESTVTPEVRKIIAGNTNTAVVTYRDGVPYDSIQEMILPGVFMVLFYLLIAFFGNQMLTSTTEEKENRVIEMILTTIEARTLIIGKILSLIVLALLQAIIIIIPVVVAYLLLHNQLNIPSLDLSSLPVNWGRIATGFGVFALSFVMFTGFLVLIGSSVPTAKEAGQFFGMIMILIFGPLYVAGLFVSAPDSGIVRFLSFFPLTAPIPLLLRNALGNLHPWEIAVALPILALTSVIILALAVRVFRYGALEYSRKLSLKEILRRRA